MLRTPSSEAGRAPHGEGQQHPRRRRLVGQGYGEYCPLEAGHNEKAWEKNRRVEFKVVKTEEGLTGVDRGCQSASGKGVYPPKVEK